MIELNYRKVTGSVKPDELDVTSSASTVYLRKNIQEVTLHDDLMDIDYTQWQYDEAQISVEEYEQYQSYFHTQEIMKQISEQELTVAEELITKDEQIQELAQSISELELMFVENQLKEE